MATGNQKKEQAEGGGVAIAARLDISNKITKVENIEDDDQDVVWVELKKNQKESIFIGTYYGKEEKQPKEEIQKEFEQLNTQINMLKKKGDIILTGDFNAKLKVSTDNHKQELSPNGKHLQNLIEMNELEVISLRSEPGKWTRQNRHKSDEKSIIDYIITTKAIAENVNEVIVDEKGLHRIKGKKETDHNTIITEINTGIKTEIKKIKRWNLNNQEGWGKYNHILQQEYKQNKPQSQEDLQNLIIRTMHRTIGQTTIKIGGNKMKESEKIKQIRETRNKTKKDYKKALKNKEADILEKQQSYFKAQQSLRQEIEIEQKEIIKTKLKKTSTRGHHQINKLLENENPN